MPRSLHRLKPTPEPGPRRRNNLAAGSVPKMATLWSPFSFAEAGILLFVRAYALAFFRAPNQQRGTGIWLVQRLVRCNARRHHVYRCRRAQVAHVIRANESDSEYDVLYRAPFAVLGIRTDGEWLCELDYLPLDVSPREPVTALAHEAVRQIERYLADPAFRFDLPLRIRGSEFRKRVWEVMQTIPAGQTLTYGEVARRLESAARAVGGACGDNRIPLIIPCHRVVARNGIGGFMHTTGKRETGIKRWLLAHEQGASGVLQ